MLLDVGCGGGIDNSWRSLGARLRAIAIDPNIAEIERLKAAESDIGVEYIAAFAGLPDEHPLAKPMTDHGLWRMNPWRRLSAYRSIELQQSAIKRMTDVEKVGVNAWRHATLAEGATVYLPRLLSERGVADVDFVKIDVDGPDFQVLQSLKECFESKSILGVGIEVNFCGSEHPLDNTFHNVDRLMRENGFDLFALTVRKYSATALPAPYLLSVPAQSTFGRPFQGDALYLRDLAAPHCSEFALRMSAEKLVKLACIFSLSALPDCAAEILVTFREKLNGLLDVDQALDLLVAQTELGPRQGLNYRGYIQAFERDAKEFYSANRERSDDARQPRRKSIRQKSLWAVGKRLQFWR